MTYFEAFGIEPKLALDTDDLQKRFYAFSRELHPDRFTRRPVEEQQQALEKTSVLNDGLRALKDPVRRAEYVLKSHGFDIGEQARRTGVGAGAGIEDETQLHADRSEAWAQGAALAST